MHTSFASVLAGAAIWASTVLGMALAVDGAAGAGLVPSFFESPSPFAQVNNNASLLFAWELVGGAPDQSALHYLCVNFSQISGTWAAEGLNTTLIQQVIESTGDAPPNPAAAYDNVLFYNTEIFVTQLLNLAPGDTGFLNVLCNDLSTELLTSASLNATRVLTAVCGAAGVAVPPGSPAGGSPETGIQVDEDISSLYGWQAVGISNNTEQLTYNCDNFQALSVNLAKLGLIISEIEQVFCSQANDPVTPAQGKHQMVYLGTEIFLQTLLHVSEAEGYFNILCSSLNTTAMDDINLDGQRVSSQVCSLHDSA